MAISKELQELIELAIAPGDFGDEKFKIIERRAQKEDVSPEELSKHIDFQMQEFCNSKKQYALEGTSEDAVGLDGYTASNYVNKGLFWTLESDGSCMTYSRNHKYLFFGKPVVLSMDSVLNMRYADTRHCLLPGRKVFYGDQNSNNKIRLSKKKEHELRQHLTAFHALFTTPEAKKIVPFRTSRHALTRPNLRVYNDYIFYRHTSILGTEKVVGVYIPDIAFYNVTGVLLKNIYFGRYFQIEIDGLKDKTCHAIEEHCKRHGALIEYDPLFAYQSNPFCLAKLLPSNWFRHEEIVLTEDAAIFNSRTLFSRDTIYLPYDMCMFGSFDKCFFAGKFEIFGEQNIQPRLTFSKKDVLEPLRKFILQKFNVGPVKKYHPLPEMLIAWIPGVADLLHIPELVFTSEGIILKHCTYKSNNNYDSKRRVIAIRYDNIIDHQHRRRWPLGFMRYHYILASSLNIRKDQKTMDIYLKFPDAPFWSNIKQRLQECPQSGLLEDFSHEDYEEFHKGENLWKEFKDRYKKSFAVLRVYNKYQEFNN